MFDLIRANRRRSIALVVAFVAFVALVGGMYTQVQASDINRKQADAATYLASYAEAVKADPYVACAASYAGTSFALPFSKDPVAVSYWNKTNSVFDPTCGADSGLQRITLSIRSTDSRVVANLQLAKRLA